MKEKFNTQSRVSKVGLEVEAKIPFALSEKANAAVKALDDVERRLINIEDIVDDVMQAYILGAREHIQEARKHLSYHEITMAAIEMNDAGAFAKEHKYFYWLAQTFFAISGELYKMAGDKSNENDVEKPADELKKLPDSCSACACWSRIPLPQATYTHTMHIY